ncbi:hypothetical protein ACGFMK_23185 [Amycolatopsis sp. NPDC049252]|uniref:hypothetical protein n=1 Tax=Amycolatopsis sp. NPDC049252 TaxID=3363933 RepID=UPI003713D9E0
MSAPHAVLRVWSDRVLVANSCLLRIGGLLSCERGGVRVMHLADVLASTEEDA